jgi:hypothetical protein
MLAIVCSLLCQLEDQNRPIHKAKFAAVNGFVSAFFQHPHALRQMRSSKPSMLARLHQRLRLSFPLGVGLGVLVAPLTLCGSKRRRALSDFA